MKKYLACILVLMLVLTSLPVFAEETEEAQEEAQYNYDELVVGTTTAFNGNFFSPLFGQNASDLDVQNLIHGYNMVEWNGSVGAYELNDSVISGSYVTEDEAGNRTFNLVFYDDLYYSDGTRITAKDYAFSILLSMSPRMRELGVAANASDAIKGSDDYKAEKYSYLSGIRLTGDMQMSITVKKEYLPFFYEKGLLNYKPYPIYAIAPECELLDDGNGVYISNGYYFSKDNLKDSLLNAKNGYVTYPSVVSGPYKLVSYNGEEAVFEINEYFKGDSEGKMPLIPRIIYRHVTNESMLDELAKGDLDLINKCVLADNIAAGIQMVSDGGFAMGNYPRIGQSFISFCCESRPMSSQAVRQAIAYCMDKDAVVSGYVGDYGVRVDGYYGIGQWMYQILNTGAFPTEDAAWNELSLDNVKVYDLDLEAAKKLLEEDGWVMDQDADIRTKRMDGRNFRLELTMFYPEGNAIAGILDEAFVQNLNKVGIKLKMQSVPMIELLRIYYRQTKRECDMIYLATNFDEIFDPSFMFDPADANRGISNRTGLQDEELYQLAVDMRQTEPGDTISYCQKWAAFQEKFAEDLPLIPIYSNVYFDFYTDKLQDYTANKDGYWSKAIIGCYLADIGAEEDTQAQ